jgi:hypothetical protein
MFKHSDFNEKHSMKKKIQSEGKRNGTIIKNKNTSK